MVSEFCFTGLWFKVPSSQNLYEVGVIRLAVIKIVKLYINQITFGSLQLPDHTRL